MKKECKIEVFSLVLSEFWMPVYFALLLRGFFMIYFLLMDLFEMADFMSCSLKIFLYNGSLSILGQSPNPLREHLLDYSSGVPPPSPVPTTQYFIFHRYLIIYLNDDDILTKKKKP